MMPIFLLHYLCFAVRQTTYLLKRSHLDPFTLPPAISPCWLLTLEKMGFKKTTLDGEILLSTIPIGFYSNDWLALKWLQHFERHILRVDGYGSHLSYEIL